ncbi:MAG TPA: flagellar basal body P-ring formation chaperone FlgA [Vicinamibacterales bacterium]
MTPILWTLLALAALGAVDLAPPATSAEAAIVRAVVDRMGEEADVVLEGLRVPAGGSASGALRAVPPPGARTGRLVTFSLFEGTRRLGTATATVRVTLPHARTLVSVARDELIGATDVAVTRGVLDGVPFTRVPSILEVVGAQVRRDVVVGEPLTSVTIRVGPAVRSGDTVEVVSRFGAVEARGVGLASGSGRVGEEVRVSSPGQRALRTARVVGPGVVELTRRGPSPTGKSKQGEAR